MQAKHISQRIFNDTRNLLIIIDKEQTERVQVSLHILSWISICQFALCILPLSLEVSQSLIACRSFYYPLPSLSDSPLLLPVCAGLTKFLDEFSVDFGLRQSVSPPPHSCTAILCCASFYPFLPRVCETNEAKLRLQAGRLRKKRRHAKMP